MSLLPQGNVFPLSLATKSSTIIRARRLFPFGFRDGLGRKAGANIIPAPQNHFVYVTALACSDRLKQIFLIVLALSLFAEPDEVWWD
jgi:hypothetical protein